MSLMTLGNCRHYWEFTSGNFSVDRFADQVGSSDMVLNTGSPSYTTANGVQGLDLSGLTQYLTAAEVQAIGEISAIQVLGYRGGGIAYGLATLSTTSGFNWRTYANANTFNFWRSAAATTGALLNQSAVNVCVGGVRLDTGAIFAQVDDNAESTGAATPAANDAAINNPYSIQFGRYGTTLDPIQQVYEVALYIGDVTAATGYADEIAALLTKYGI